MLPPGDDVLALGWGLLTGDDAGFSAEFRPLLRSTGTSHLAAASGANLEYVLSKVRYPMHRFSAIVRSGLSMLAVISYLVMVGNSGSLWRATLMWLYQVAARTVGRPVVFRYQVLVVLVATVFFMPAFLRSDGFWLSLLAVSAVHFSHAITSSENTGGFYRQARWLATVAQSVIIVGVTGGWIWWRLGSFVTVGAFLTPLLSIGVNWYQDLTLIWLSLDVIQWPLGQSVVYMTLHGLFIVCRCLLIFGQSTNAVAGPVVLTLWIFLGGQQLRRGWQGRQRRRIAREWRRHWVV